MNPTSASQKWGRLASSRRVSGVLTLIAILSLGACASPPRTVARPDPEPAPPPPSTEVYFYPAKGQSAEQQDSDRYECYLWARQQTGFDPSSPNLAPHQRLIIEPAPPSGQDTAAGAVTGAVIGAMLAPGGNSGEGAVVGAITGAMIGSASDAARQEQADQLQQQSDARHAQRVAQIEQQAQQYRRAMAACLQGHDYTVR